MYKITIPWKADLMDNRGIKTPKDGTVELVCERILLNRLHEEVTRRVYEAHPELRSTPLLIGKFYKEAA